MHKVVVLLLTEEALEHAKDGRDKAADFEVAMQWNRVVTNLENAIAQLKEIRNA